jgi:fumarate reductase subunit D
MITNLFGAFSIYLIIVLPILMLIIGLYDNPMINISIGRTIIKYIENAPNKLVIIASIRMMSLVHFLYI